MKGKQLAILLVLGLALGGAWYVFSKRNQESWSETGGGGGKVAEFPINDVTHVVIKNATTELNLVKKGDAWTVKERADYPANFEDIGNLLRKLWDLKTVQEVKVGPSQLPRLELVEPGKGDKSGTLVQLLGANDKPVGGVLLGKKHMREGGGGMDFGGPSEGFPAGRYVKPLANNKVSLVSETLDEVDPKPEKWLAKDFIKVEGPKSVTVKGSTDAQKWSVSRDSASTEWKLADAKPDEKLDTAKVAPLSNVLSSPTFNDVLAPDAKLEEPITNATIETFDGFKYELKIGKANGDNYPVQVKVTGSFPKERTPGKDEKPEDKTKLDGEFVVKTKKLEEKLAKEQKAEGRIYLVAKYTVDPLLKERSGLFADKPAATPAPAPGATTSPATAPHPAVPAVPAKPPVPPTPAGATKPAAPSASNASPAPHQPVTVTTPPMTAPPPAKVEAASAPVAAPAANPAPAKPAPPAATPAAPSSATPAPKQ